MTRIQFEKEASENKTSEKDIINLAKKLGCISSDITVCRIYLKEVFYNQFPEDNTWN